jgi:uncharacterized protein YyaL (SSP411 family)
MERASFEREDAAAVDLVKAALDDLVNSFDERFGGFGGAPKFPPHTAPGKAEVALRVRVQPCSEDACLAPQTHSAPLALHIT